MRFRSVWAPLLVAGTLAMIPLPLMGSERPVIHGTLTLDQAVQTALRESPIVRGASAEVEAAIGQLGVARANARPMVSANSFAAGGSLGNILTSTAPVMPQMFQMVGPGEFFDQNLMLMVPLYTGGRLRALVRQAEAARRAESADLEAVRLDVATMTRTAYRQERYQRALLAVYEASAAAHRERLRITRAALEVGKVPQFYVPRDEAELANAEQQLTNTRRDAATAMVQLKTWMGVSLASDFQLAEPAEFEPVAALLSRWGVGGRGARERGGEGGEGERERGSEGARGRGEAGLCPRRPLALSPPRPLAFPSLALSHPRTLAPSLPPLPADPLPALLRLAEENRPELAAARERWAGGRDGVRAARSQNLPQVSAGVSADLMRTRDQDLRAGITFGLVTSLPIFDGGLRRSQARAAEAERGRLEQEKERVALQVRQEVTQAWLALQAADQTVRTAETGRRAAQEEYRVVQVRYEAGKGINLELLDAIAARTRAETNVAQAFYEYGVAQDQLARAIGRRS